MQCKGNIFRFGRKMCIFSTEN